MRKCNYVVTNKKANLVKIGMFSDNNDRLLRRYLGIYGKNINIYVFENEKHKETEKKCKEIFSDFCYSVKSCSELYPKNKLDDILDFFQKETNAVVEILNDDNIENLKSVGENIKEYREKKNLTDEQIKENTVKRQEDKENSKHFCLVTSPLVDLIFICNTKYDGKYIANIYSIYFGPDTEVYFIDTTITRTNPIMFKKRIHNVFAEYNDIWSVYYKELDLFLGYISRINIYTIMYEKKRMYFIENTEYDPNKKYSAKYKKISNVNDLEPHSVKGFILSDENEKKLQRIYNNEDKIEDEEIKKIFRNEKIFPMCE